MEDITTRNNIITDLEQYIKKSPFLNPKTKKQEICLHNLPNDETLFDIISQLREKYKNETFVITQNINITNKNIDKEVNFSNCIFNERISFNGTIFKLNVDFSNSKFKKDSSFGGSKFFRTTRFLGTTFKNAIFINTIFGDKETVNEYVLTEFSYSHFDKVTFVYSKVNTIATFLCSTFTYSSFYNVNFHSVIFEKLVDFSGTKLILNEEVANQDIKEINLEETPSLDFRKAEFKEIVYFDNIDYKGSVDFSKAIFGKEKDNISYTRFSDAKFDKDVRFYYSKFYSLVIFKNTKFKNLADFYKAHFYKAQQFYLTDFLDRAIFSNTTFKGETQFLYNKVESNSYINFESAKFEKGLDISRANFNCNLNFWNIFIQDDKIFEFTNYTDDFGEHKEEAVPSVYKQLRETYRIIKSNFYSQNNKIEGLKFYEKEMSVYLEEKREETNKKSPPKNKKTFIEKFREKFMEEPILSVGQLLILFFTILWTILKCPIFYIASAIFTSLIISGIIIKNKESLKYRNPIKQNYYMPIILLVIAIILLYFYIYNIHNIKNPFYIIVTYIMLFFSMLLFYFPLEKDKIILWLNKNSNEFDTNWVVGVNFSLLVGCLTYFTILLSINSNIVFDKSPEGISNFLTSLVDVFNITKWDNLEIIGVKLKGFSYLLLFIGRIFIGYGYYQTIQAFRKFGKS